MSMRNYSHTSPQRKWVNSPGETGQMDVKYGATKAGGETRFQNKLFVIKHAFLITHIYKYIYIQRDSRGFKTSPADLFASTELDCIDSRSLG